MRVLLTGAAGFIGAAIRAELSARGHEVVALDAFIPQAHGAMSTNSTSTNSTSTEPDDRARDVHRVDIRDGDGVPRLLPGIDVVCHQAAMVGAGVTVADLPLYASHNDLGTAVLLAQMTEQHIDRLVLASSMVVYGEGRYSCPDHGEQVSGARRRTDLEAGVFDGRCPTCGQTLRWSLVDEAARLDPRSSYAASKVAQEHYATAWARQAPAAAIALRYHNVYGPGMPRDTPYSGVAAMFRSALEHDEPPRVFEDGRQMRDFVHVADVARANAIAVESVGTAAPESVSSYNVCSGTPISIGEVARAISVGAGQAREPVVTGQFRSGDVRHIVASPERARAELGYAAEITPEQGLADFATAPLRE